MDGVVVEAAAADDVADVAGATPERTAPCAQFRRPMSRTIRCRGRAALRPCRLIGQSRGQLRSSPGRIGGLR